MTIAENTISPNATAGSSQLRVTMLAKNNRAQITATKTRIVLAGSTALTSVYDGPVTMPRPENASPYRSSQ
jgi:hypothetical protein